jgi:putative PIN family toxin of toxin-antitoxin system
MRHWVIDTNVVVSGLLNPHGPPGEILDAVVDGRVTMVYDPRIVAEYRDVLHRPRLRLRRTRIRAFLAGLRSQRRVTPTAEPSAGPDADDLKFIQAALATSERTIVTGNVDDFPTAILGGATVLTPAEAVAVLRADVRP